jgi:ribosomal protein S17
MKKEKINAYKKKFEGIVKKIAKPIATIEFNRIIYNPKYERFAKSRTKIHARIPNELLDKIKLNDEVVIVKCRPLSKTVHHIITKIKEIK